MEAELARLRQQVAMLLERSSLVAAVPNSLIPVEQNESQNGAKKSNSSTDSGVSDAEDFEPLDSNETKNAVPVALPPALAPPPPPPIPPPSPLKLDLAKVCDWLRNCTFVLVLVCELYNRTGLGILQSEMDFSTAGTSPTMRG